MKPPKNVPTAAPIAVPTPGNIEPIAAPAAAPALAPTAHPPTSAATLTADFAVCLTPALKPNSLNVGTTSVANSIPPPITALSAFWC